MIAGSLEFAVPITLGALAGILSERSGMLNIALEGKMLIGACVASVAASVGLLVTGNALLAVVIGITAAMLVAGGVGILLAWMGIRHKMDQIIAGTVINIGAVGITNFLFLRVLSRNTQFNTPPTIEPWRVPLLADIPILGPILFAAKPYVYLMYVHGRRPHLHAVPDPLGPPAARVGREAGGRRDGRHRRHLDPLPGAVPRRAHLRAGRLVPVARRSPATSGWRWSPARGSSPSPR